MTIEIGKYQFHSWARRGIAANITDRDDLGEGGSATVERAAVPLSVKLNGNAIAKNFSLIGPGDIIGINRDMIIRTEPLNWITDREPNYLAFAEFYDEDFCWRYTPAMPQDTHKEKLRPWIFLLVLKEDEFKRTDRKLPLPTITISRQEVFPPKNETWLWAHVHSHADIPESDLTSYEKFLMSLNKTVNDDPDQLYSRLMSPRKLDPNTAYYVFIVPSFETGRLAGLEQPTAGVNAQEPSWDGSTDAGKEMPVYYEWFFRTGVNTDFESLARLIQARSMDDRIGIRSMDCSDPGFVTLDGTAFPAPVPAIMGLEGALKSPDTVSNPKPEGFQVGDFQIELEKLVNQTEEKPDGDPLVSAPFYGQYYAKKSVDDVVTLDVNKDTWLNDLNRDPRTRVPAGFGTSVVQKNQEAYMRKAWEQVRKILEANKRIKAARFAMSVAAQYMKKTFSRMEDARLLAISSPVLKKIKGGASTIYQLLRESRLPAAVFSGTFRRMARPKGPLSRKLTSGKKLDYVHLVKRINEGKLTPSPPKGTPAGLFTTRSIAGSISPYRPAPVKWLLNIRDNRKQIKVVKAVPPRSEFGLQVSDEKNLAPPAPGLRGQDNIEARNFRAACIDLNKRLGVKADEKALIGFKLKNAKAKVSAAINPVASYPGRLTALVRLPRYIQLSKQENIFPAMAYPDFDDPMYKKLAEISGDLLLPNLQLVPPNTISLLETNPKFIESYMVGLNHEMGRELLWREYPTDQRGSYFRQFWDVKGIIRPPDGGQETAALTEQYKDIGPIHTWPSRSALGTHNNRASKGYKAGDAKQLVLVIRADLLKRYPNSIIFAQKAIDNTDKVGKSPVISLELTDDEFGKQVKFPLFRAEIAPEIKFFGFDLTIEQAKGMEKSQDFDDNLGWFFVIQEVPGEPRFGMDITFDEGSDGLSWDDLAWTNLPDDTTFIKGGVRPGITPTDSDRWAADSANMAYVLFQKPNMLAVHAKDMLDKV